MSFKRGCAIVLVASLVAPIVFTYRNVQTGLENLKQGVIETTEWLPKNATTVISDDREAHEKFVRTQTGVDSKHRIWNRVFKDDYQARLNLGQPHLVQIYEDMGAMTFFTTQGVVVCWIETVPITQPSYVWISNKEYIGNSTFRWEISGVNYITSVISGVAKGLGVDFLLLILAAVIYGVKEEVRDRLRKWPSR